MALRENPVSLYSLLLSYDSDRTSFSIFELYYYHSNFIKRYRDYHRSSRRRRMTRVESLRDMIRCSKIVYVKYLINRKENEGDKEGIYVIALWDDC